MFTKSLPSHKLLSHIKKLAKKFILPGTLKMTYPQNVTHQIVTFCDFLTIFRKLSTKNTTKLENSSNRYGLLNILS